VLYVDPSGARSANDPACTQVDDAAAIARMVSSSGESRGAATYAVYCRSGNRSAVATAEMGTLGYPHVYDLDGGFADLESAGMPAA
ncbi:MAG: rhodanese-like domain-containing protein, partial [bacterium]